MVCLSTSCSVGLPAQPTQNSLISGGLRHVGPTAPQGRRISSGAAPQSSLSAAASVFVPSDSVPLSDATIPCSSSSPGARSSLSADAPVFVPVGRPPGLDDARHDAFEFSPLQLASASHDLPEQSFSLFDDFGRWRSGPSKICNLSRI